MRQPTRKRKDPLDLPVQVNFQIPYAYREFIIDQARIKSISMSELIRDCIDSQYGRAYTASRGSTPKAEPTIPWMEDQ